MGNEVRGKKNTFHTINVVRISGQKDRLRSKLYDTAGAFPVCGQGVLTVNWSARAWTAVGKTLDKIRQINNDVVL